MYVYNLNMYQLTTRMMIYFNFLVLHVLTKKTFGFGGRVVFENFTDPTMLCEGDWSKICTSIVKSAPQLSISCDIESTIQNVVDHIHIKDLLDTIAT